MKPSAAISFVRLFITILFSAAASFYCLAQKVVIHGVVRDSESRAAVYGASVMIKGEFRGTHTDVNGCFTLEAGRADSIVIRHISYNTGCYAVSEKGGNPVEIILKPVSHDLPGATVVAPVPEPLLGEGRFYITDYEFMDGNILLLGFREKKVWMRCLLLVTPDGDTLASAELTEAKGLYSDCAGGIWVIQKETATIVFFEDDRLQLGEKESLDHFYKWSPYVVACDDKFYYIQEHTRMGQALINYVYRPERDSLWMFSEILNGDGIARNRWGAMFDGSEADLRFQYEIMNKPIYAPLFLRNDSVIIFNFPENSLQVYHSGGTDEASIEMTTAKIRGELREVLADQATGRFFTLIENNGRYHLEMLSADAKAVAVWQIPEFRFPEKIGVMNNICYFLYTEKTGEQYRRLYSFKL